MDTSDKRALAAREAYVLGRIREHGAFTCTVLRTKAEWTASLCSPGPRAWNIQSADLEKCGILAEMGLLNGCETRWSAAGASTGWVSHRI